MLKLYEDKGQTFKCKLKVEGADLNNAFTRMVLSGENMDYIFKGKIDKTGQCIVYFPPLNNFGSRGGTATLEVIVENGFFQPLKLDYEVKKQNIVEVTNIEFEDEKKRNVVVESIGEEKTNNDKEYIKEIKEIIKEYKSLSNKDKKIVREQVLRFKPGKNIKKATQKIFPDINSFSSKLYMYYKTKVKK